METLASCGFRAAEHGGPRWTTWPTALPNAKEASAETCAVPTTERRSSLANGPKRWAGCPPSFKKPFTRLKDAVSKR